MSKKKREEKPVHTEDKKRLAARIPISEWYEIERKMAIISRMTGS
ncbi:MAG: hypothetical protein ACFFAY_15025 [Promethearchaeota archaeon]